MDELQNALGEYTITPSATNFANVVMAQERLAQARHTEAMAAIADVRTYIEKIEAEANDMMSGMTDPENMLKMAGKFLGQ